MPPRADGGEQVTLVSSAHVANRKYLVRWPDAAAGRRPHFLDPSQQPAPDVVWEGAAAVLAANSGAGHLGEAQSGDGRWQAQPSARWRAKRASMPRPDLAQADVEPRSG